SALALIAPWDEPWGRTIARAPRWLRAACLVLALAPAGYYAKIVGPTFAHVLYTGSVANDVWCDAQDRCESDREQHVALRALGVMIPPEPRLLRRYFALECRPGDRLLLHDPRDDSFERGAEIEERSCSLVRP